MIISPTNFSVAMVFWGANVECHSSPKLGISDLIWQSIIFQYFNDLSKYSTANKNASECFFFNSGVLHWVDS